MQRRKWKKIALWATGIFPGLVVILAAHIWWVMKPRIDAGTRVMARIDLRQRIGPQDAGQIQAWLYRQNGVKYVLVNPGSRIAVFSFAPVENDGSRIVQDLRTQTRYKLAERYLPPPGALAGSCPVASTSLTYKVYAWMKHVF